MKGKKSFLTLLMACVVVVLFCLTGTAIAGPGPNPSIPAGFKVIGPTLKGVIVAGWLDAGSNLGIVEVFLRVDDQLYTGIITKTNPEIEFLNTEPIDITEWALPKRLVTDYNMGEDAIAVVFDEKDVSNLEIIPDVELDVTTSPNDMLSYTHVLHCNVKISFLLPKK